MDFLPLRIDRKKVYAGFWDRLMAAITDMIIIYPILFLIIASRKYGYSLAIIGTILFAGLFVAYSVSLNLHWGGSVGKRLAGIKITKPDGTRIGWVEAWMRSSVDVLHALLCLYTYLIPLMQIDSQQFSAAALTEREQFLGPYHPLWYHFAYGLIQVWYWSEPVVLLFNKRKRALHDFLAGTVVIYDQFAVEVRSSDRKEAGLLPDRSIN